MTDLNKRLAEEYVVDYNITKAADRAHIQGDNKRIIAWQMLQIPDVMDYVEQLQAEAAKRCSVTKDDLINEFKKIGFSTITNYMNDDLSAKDLSKVVHPEVIKSIKKTVTDFDGGSKTQIEFTLHDKIAGLVNLGRHIGFFREDNSQRNPSTTLMLLDPLNAPTTDNCTKEDSITS